MKSNRLYVIIPCYNEEKVLPITSQMFLDELARLVENGKISDDSRLLFVDDGSGDDTWKIISELAKANKSVEGISLSCNRGQQNAIVAGLHEALGKCDVTVSIDCDGQDDISAMERMVDCYLDGSDIVYGIRKNRKKDSFFKRASARMFYKMLGAMGVKTVYDHADYRLMSERAVKALLEFRDVNLYLRGMVPLIGFKSTVIEYERLERAAGKSGYSVMKMMSLALNAVTGLSVKPLRIISVTGIIVSLLSVAGILWTLFQYFFGTTVSGWTSILCVVCFLSGVQLMSLGVVGEYIGKIYMETKSRPRYIISEKTVKENEAENE